MNKYRFEPRSIVLFLRSTFQSQIVSAKIRLSLRKNKKETDKIWLVLTNQ